MPPRPKPRCNAFRVKDVHIRRAHAMGAAVVRAFAATGRDEAGEPVKRVRLSDTLEVQVCVGHRGIQLGVPAEHDPHLHPVTMQLEFADNPDPTTGRHIRRVLLPLDFPVASADTAVSAVTAIALQPDHNNEFKKFLWHLLQTGGGARHPVHLVFDAVATGPGITGEEPVYLCVHRQPEAGREDRVWFAVHSRGRRTLTSPELQAAEAAAVATALEAARVSVVPGVPPATQTDLGYDPGHGWEEPYLALNVDTAATPRWHCRGVLTFCVHRGAHPDREALADAATAGGGLEFWPPEAVFVREHSLEAHGVRLDNFGYTMVALDEAKVSGSLSQFLQLLLDALAGRNALQAFQDVSLSSNMYPLCNTPCVWAACFPEGVDLAPLTYNGALVPVLVEALCQGPGKLTVLETILRRVVETSQLAGKDWTVSCVCPSGQTPLLIAVKSQNGVATWTLLQLGAETTSDHGAPPFRVFLERQRFWQPQWSTATPVTAFVAFATLAHHTSALFVAGDPEGTTLTGLTRALWPDAPPAVVHAAIAWDRAVGRWNPLRAAWVRATVLSDFFNIALCDSVCEE